MAITENILDFIPSIDRYVSLIRAATDAEDLVNAVREYLASWSERKIGNLQRIDGGWGPFDRYGQVVRLRTVADVSRIGETVRRQIVALKAVEIALNPEIVELDRFFSIAREVADERAAISARKYAATPGWGDRP